MKKSGEIMTSKSITEYQAYMGILLYYTHLYNQTVDKDKFIDPALFVDPEVIPELRKYINGLNWSEAASATEQCLLYLANCASVKEKESGLSIFKKCKGCK